LWIVMVVVDEEVKTAWCGCWGAWGHLGRSFIAKTTSLFLTLSTSSLTTLLIALFRLSISLSLPTKLRARPLPCGARTHTEDPQSCWSLVLRRGLTGRGATAVPPRVRLLRPRVRRATGTCRSGGYVAPIRWTPRLSAGRPRRAAACWMGWDGILGWDEMRLAWPGLAPLAARGACGCGRARKCAATSSSQGAVRRAGASIWSWFSFLFFLPFGFFSWWIGDLFVLAAFTTGSP
jgi:hypothetical protein